MTRERLIAMPGLWVGFCTDGSAAAVAVPASSRTVVSIPDAALADGTAQALKLRQMVGSRTGCIMMSRGISMFGAGEISDSALGALRHELVRRLELPEDAIAFLLQGRRRELTPVGAFVERCVEAWSGLEAGTLLPGGWTSFEMPFLTLEGMMRLGVLSVGDAVPMENRIVLLATDASVRADVLQQLLDRSAKPVFAWLRAVGVLSAADVVMAVSTGGGRPLASIEDPVCKMLSKAFELALEHVSRNWAKALGRTIRVRLEGGNEVEAENLIMGLTGVGPWLRSARTPREASGILRASLEQSALPGLDVSGFAMRLGEASDALSLSKVRELEDLQSGRRAITLSMARGNLSTTFCV